MATQTPPERPRHADTGHDYREAKATAKAAKAYAKSQRPWYKKKRWWAAGLLLIIIVASVGGGAGSDNSKPTSSVNTSQPAQQASPAQPEKPSTTNEPAMTSGQKNALQSAHNYLDMSGFSKRGLIQQLSSSAGEGFSRADATYAATHAGANWNKEAVEAAQEYLDSQSFSRAGLIQQLSSPAGSGFTLAQARYAASKVY
jgi:hypothetical protein